MGRCSRCGRKRFLRSFPRRLDIPELRAMVSHWPWHRVQICPACEPAFQREFDERLALLAPQAVAAEGDVTQGVCLMCGNQDPDAKMLQSARWTDAAGAPVATRFHVCPGCHGRLLVNNIVSAAELASAADLRALLPRLPEVGAELIKRNEGWSLAEGPGPEGSQELERDLSLETAAQKAHQFWAAPPVAIAETDGTPVRGATLLPDAAGAIRTRLELQWRTGRTDTPVAVALAVYRTSRGYTLVRYAARPAG